MSANQKMKLVFLGLSLCSTLLIHLPDAPFGVQAAGHAFANLIGQEHRWTQFSADPRSTSLDLWAEVVSANGITDEWRIERRRVGGDLAYYHWVKWMEAAVLEPDRARLDGLARWLAASYAFPVKGITIYGAQQPGVPPGEPFAPVEIAVLGRYPGALPSP
ncbi:MAG TPA: hypothetical protein VJ935_09950 [Acidimicrobiia bacterium]|nr:hypothetical protein [Acidimicrobiia bacterium]